MDAKKILEFCGRCHHEHKALIQSLQADNDRLRVIEGKANNVIITRGKMLENFTIKNGDNFKLSIKELEDALKLDLELKGGS